jgi:hypothetical protein
MATTTNYGWTTPDDTALVKDGAAAIRTLGSSVDTTTKALNPSTTLGDIEYRSSTANTNTRLGIGSTGNVLTVAGGVPTWSAPAAGGMTLINTGGTALSSTATTISSIPSTYISLQMFIVNYTPSNAEALFLRVNSDSGTSYINIETDGRQTNLAPGGSSTVLALGNNSSTSQSLVITEFPYYSNSTTWKWWSSKAITNNPTTSTNANTTQESGIWFNTAAINSITLIINGGGTFNGGTVYLYGVK